MTKPKSKTNWLYIVIIIFVTFSVAAGILICQKQIFKGTENNQANHGACLADNETVDYTINRRQFVSPVDIIIKDKESGRKIYKFTIDSVLPVWQPVQSRRCGVYILRAFNYDPRTTKQPPGYRDEIWYYSYKGEGQSLILLSMKDEFGNFHDFFSLEFSVDFLEIYLALIKGYLGQIDFATVIKEIKTKEDVFELLLKDITDKYPSLEGSIGLRDWTKDSRYFWGETHDGAYTFGFFRIDTTNWKVDILPIPGGTSGGAAFNPEYGYVTYDTGPGWIGIVEVAEQVYEEWRKEGKIVELYLYNLFTKEKTLLATSQEPSWWGKPKWISDTELEYEMPDGEKKIYKLNEQ